MKETFNLDWLKIVPRMPFGVPGGYDLNHFLNWEKKYELDESNWIVSGSSFGKVYDVGDSLVAKIFRNSPFLKNNMVFNNAEDMIVPYLLEREFWLGKGLEKTEMNTPHQEGLALVYNRNLDQYHPAIIIEKIDSIDYESLSDNEIKKIEFLRDKELGKAIDGGYVPGFDARKRGNVLLSKKNMEVYPIDYMFWYKS